MADPNIIPYNPRQGQFNPQKSYRASGVRFWETASGYARTFREATKKAVEYVTSRNTKAKYGGDRAPIRTKTKAETPKVEYRHKAANAPTRKAAWFNKGKTGTAGTLDNLTAPSKGWRPTDAPNRRLGLSGTTPTKAGGLKALFSRGGYGKSPFSGPLGWSSARLRGAKEFVKNPGTRFEQSLVLYVAHEVGKSVLDWIGQSGASWRDSQSEVERKIRNQKFDALGTIGGGIGGFAVKLGGFGKDIGAGLTAGLALLTGNHSLAAATFRASDVYDDTADWISKGGGISSHPVVAWRDALARAPRAIKQAQQTIRNNVKYEVEKDIDRFVARNEKRLALNGITASEFREEYFLDPYNANQLAKIQNAHVMQIDENEIVNSLYKRFRKQGK